MEDDGLESESEFAAFLLKQVMKCIMETEVSTSSPSAKSRVQVEIFRHDLEEIFLLSRTSDAFYAI